MLALPFTLVVEGAKRSIPITVINGKAAAAAVGALLLTVNGKAEGDVVSGGQQCVAFGGKLRALAADAAVGLVGAIFLFA